MGSTTRRPDHPRQAVLLGARQTARRNHRRNAYLLPVAERPWAIQVVSDVDVDALTAEVSYCGEVWAVILDYGTDQPLRLQVFPRSSPTRRSDSWDFDFTEALSQLEQARKDFGNDCRQSFRWPLLAGVKEEQHALASSKPRRE